MDSGGSRKSEGICDMVVSRNNHNPWTERVTNLEAIRTKNDPLKCYFNMSRSNLYG